MTYTQAHGNLWAASLTPEQHERTCDYWFTVTSGATSLTAFSTRPGLDRWLSERGLSLEGELPEAGTSGFTRITGEYRSVSHGEHVSDDPCAGMRESESWHALRPVMASATLSNGRYTLALITEDDGVRTVHTLNPNVKTRVEFDRRNAAAWLAS
jgi:hypothetical protein